MKNQLLFIALCATTFLNAQSITITSTIPNAEVDSNITVNYTYSSMESDSYIYVGLSLYNASGKYDSFVVGAATGAVNGPGTDVMGSISFTIPVNTTLSADLPTGFTYEISVEMKEKTNWTVIAADYPKVETILVASGTLSTASFTEELNGISVYPNPASERLNIQNINDLDISNIKISNILGKEVYSSKFKKNVIDISNLNSGVFILTIKSDNKLKNIKFIKQ